MKFTFCLLCVGLLTFSVATAQDKPPDKAAIVDSFKQKIQDILKVENAAKGPEHAAAISTEASPIRAKKKMLHKDGTPCSAFHAGLCHYAWIDDSGAQYLNTVGKPCGGDTCVVWTRAYFAAVSTYSFDVKQTDSLVTPYTGILTSSDVVWSTAGHATREEAEQDGEFHSSSSNPSTVTYGYQGGQWNLLK